MTSGYNTRETMTSRTILDHVCTNLYHDQFHLSIIDSPLSDHKQIYLELKKYRHSTTQKKNYKSIDYTALYTSMKESEFIKNNRDYKKLEDHILAQIESHRVNKIKILNLPQEDWINKKITDGIYRRNAIWKQVKKNPKNKEMKKLFTEKRNSVKISIRNTKREYYFNCFKNCNNDPKKIWKLINTLAKNKIEIDLKPPKLLVNGLEIEDGREICEQFNIFFSSIGTTLAGKIHTNFCKELSDTMTMTYLDCEPSHTLTEFNPCSPDEIKKIINKLDADCSTGIDGINTKSIKCLSDIIVDNLSDCINHCLSAGYFPDSLKKAKISPIYKSGPKTDTGNYRPISVLPVISKVFEKVIHKRISTHLETIKFLYEHQYGFRPQSSTLSAVIDLVTKIDTKIDQKNICLGIFIDLKKAFDTVSHSLLLAKLKNIGISGSAYALLESYLSNRIQIVKIGNICSSPRKIECGIPQGSILGPLLFLIYVNNISNIGLTGHVTLYADDTCLFYFGKKMKEIVDQAQKDLVNYNIWCQCNLLTINTKKTSFMIFSAKNKNISDFSPIKIDNDIIQRSHKEKYLGIFLDDRLTWTPHIQTIRNKLLCVIGSLRRISSCIPQKVRQMIYNSLVKSKLDYLIEIWGGAAKTNLKPLQIAQNKVIKILFGYDRLTHTQTLYRDTKIHNIKQTYALNTCTLIKKILDGHIHTKISLTKKTYNHNLRNTDKLELHLPRTEYGKRSILYNGANMYNNLPNDIKENHTMSMFKSKLKQYISENIFE